MDINDLRSAVTLAGFIGFLAVVYRAWRRSEQASHEAASRLVFEGEAADRAASEEKLHG